jgi:phosphopentomutase
MTTFRRVILVVLDSAGIGAMPDAADWGDEGSDTLGHVLESQSPAIPNLRKLGIANIRPLPNLDPLPKPAGSFGKAAIASSGKDTTAGHWEMAGIITDIPFPTYPSGFPPRIIERFESEIGRKILGNKPASGTEIIKDLGEEHVRTGRPIVYTSADSVFQVAAHEEVVAPEELYRMCETARELYRSPPYLVGRVIARPFTGRPGSFRRTAGRRDFSLPPPGPTLLDDLAAAGLPVVAVGKIKDIFTGRGVTAHVPASGNEGILEAVIKTASAADRGLVLGNLVDFDMLYGHRNDPSGFARALEAFDRELPRLRQAALGRGRGVLVLTADHGCDPTTPSTDHSREYVPVLLEGAGVSPGVDLGTRGSLADLAATIADLLGLRAYRGAGLSFAAALGRP